MKVKIFLDDDPFPALSVGSPIDPAELVRGFKQSPADTLAFSRSGGWRPSDTAAFGSLPRDLRGLNIIAEEQRVDLSAIPRQIWSNLEYLGLIAIPSEPLDLRICSSIRHLLVRVGKNIHGLADLVDLASLNISDFYAQSIADYPAVDSLEYLRVIDETLYDLNGLERAQRLERMTLIECDRLTDITGLGGLPALRELEISYCPRMRDWSPVSRCPSIEFITIERGAKMDTLEPFFSLTRLKRLIIYNRTKLSDRAKAELDELSKVCKVVFA
jgi:hypothetical protein